MNDMNGKPNRVRLLKYMVQVVLLEEDEQGEVMGERLAEPVVFYSEEALVEWLPKVKEQITASNSNIVIAR